MAEFGPNGTVIIAPEPGEYREAPVKLKRVALACFLCGVGACVAVALIGAAIGFTGYTVMNIAGGSRDIFDERGLLAGIGFAVIISAMNWWFCYLTIPAAWIALGFSIGRFPRRGITHAGPYYRWGGIWGAILVGGTCGFFAALMALDPYSGDGFARLSHVIGASLTGLIIGAIAGVICGWLFRAIVQPAQQIRQLEVDVF